MSLSHEIGPRRYRFLVQASLTLAAIAILMFFSSTVVAAQAMPEGGSPVAEPRDPVPLDRLCVAGTVINHAEVPLEGWTVTATYEGVNGSHSALTTVTDANGEFSFELPGPGRWGLEIESRDRWEGVTATKLAVHVGFGNLDCVDVRFKMRELVRVIIIKIDDNHEPQAGWTMTATPGGGNTFADVQTAVTDDTGTATMDLTPGSWIISESAPGYVRWWRPISPATGVHSLNVVGPGPITIRFKNLIEPVQNGCVNVFKYDVPPDPNQPSFGLAGWPIKVLRADGSVAAEGETDSFGQVTFTGLPYGPYTVREIVQAGWVPHSPSTYSVFLTSQDDGCTDIIFYNKQLPNGYCITGRKLDANGFVGIPDWQILATPIEAGDFEPAPVLTDGEGRYLICMPLEDYRVPGSVYSVTEVIPDGWSPVSPVEYLVTLPDNPGIPVEVPDFVNQQTQYAGDPPVMMVAATKSGSCRYWHVVRPGESVYKLAGKYQVSGKSIFQANPWIYRQPHHWLYTGQKVCIP